MELEILKEQNPWWQAKENILQDVQIEKLSRVKHIWHPPRILQECLQTIEDGLNLLI